MSFELQFLLYPIGSFLTISLKNLACRTIAPACLISTISLPSSSFGIKDSIEISESLPVNVTPSSVATILIPVKIGIVVLDRYCFHYILDTLN